MPDRLDAMRTFVAVCDARGFAPAARRLNLSPSVVTRSVAALEGRLGIRLLQRTTRTIRLTEGGARFLERARAILAAVEEAEGSAREERARPQGRLVVSAPLLFGRMHVAPLVSRFLETFPTTSAELRLSDRFASLVEDGIDVAVRIGDLPDSGLIARGLGRTRRVVAASPAYLARHGGAPDHPSDLARHRVIAFGVLASGPDWIFRAPGGEPVRIEVVPHLATNSGDVAIDHATRGGGIVNAFCYQVDDAVRSGALVEVLAPFSPLPVPIQAVFPTSRLLSSNVRAFLDIAGREAAAWRFLGRS